jgi:hypothetical protein
LELMVERLQVIKKRGTYIKRGAYEFKKKG